MTRSALSEAGRVAGRHDDRVAEVYVRLALVETRLGDLRVAIRTRFDRIEARLSTGLTDRAADREIDGDDRPWLETHLVGIDRHLAGLASEFDGMGDHLVGIDDHLERIDAALSGILHPEPP